MDWRYGEISMKIHVYIVKIQDLSLKFYTIAQVIKLWGNLKSEAEKRLSLFKIWN